MTREIEEIGDWLIWHDPLPIEYRGADWQYVRKCANDSAIDMGREESRAMCLQTIDWIESQETDEAEAARTERVDKFYDQFRNLTLVRELSDALRWIDGEAPASEPRDGPTVGFQPSRNPEDDDGNETIREAFQEGVIRGLWLAAQKARAAHR